MKLWPIFAVAGVVGALFALKIVDFDDVAKFQCRSKQSEAKGMLKEARKRLSDHSATNGGKVPSNWLDLAWEPKTDRYSYSIDLFPDSRFVVEANGKTNEMNGDVWQIDELGKLTNKVNGCEAAVR